LMTWQWLTTNLERWLGNWFKQMGLEGTGAAANKTWYTFIGTGPLVIIIIRQHLFQEETEQFVRVNPNPVKAEQCIPNQHLIQCPSLILSWYGSLSWNVFLW
jgi:hypothetical protein